METKKKLRCPLGVPGAIIAVLIGLTGIVVNLITFNLMGLLTSLALFLLGLPFNRVTMMVHAANDRLDEIEAKINKQS
jgi:hypothetical protein